MGKVKDFQASIRVAADDLDPSEVTQLLGCEPSFAYRKGEGVPIPTRANIPGRTGMWALTDDPDKFDSLEALVLSLLEQLTSDPEAWRIVSSKYETDVFCAVSLHDDNEGFSLSPTLTTKLGERGLLIDFDVYAHDVEDADPR